MSIKKKKLAILGSTGSIGTQALEVVAEHPSLFDVEVLTANENDSLLLKQAIKFKPNVVVIKNEEKYKNLMIAQNQNKGLAIIQTFSGGQSKFLCFKHVLCYSL